MSVSNGQLANQTTFNNAFPSRTDDTSMTGQVQLGNTDPESGDTIANIQRELNSLGSFVGKEPNTPKDDEPAWENNDVGTSGDNVSERADALTERFNESSGHDHDGTPGNGAPIAASSLASVRLRGSFQRGSNLTAVTGDSLDVSTQMTGKTASSGDTVKGVVTTAQ